MSSALDEITSSFENFLIDHFPEQPDFRMRFCYFIDDLAQHDNSRIRKYVIPDSIAGEIINKYEKSGLKDELSIEIIDRGKISHAMTLKSGGDYHKALLELKDDEFILNYLKSLETGQDVGYPDSLHSFLNYCVKGDYNDPVLKRIATLEYFILIVYLSLE